ncbi:MAG: hypothetical protein J6S61_04605, partial [Elusimicrobiaceae bacterium]|nr:hypothetical protein [Elusimicrobiaceae bacterium]
MKKIITSLVSIVLLLGALCPVCAQEDNIEYLAGLEISNRTHFQSISDQDFKFPSSEEAIKVFRQGKKLLDTMERKITAAPPCAQLPSDLAAYKSYFSTVDYHEVVQSALVEKQNDQDLKHYRDFYNQIVWKEDGTPDLTKAATAKAYLAFYYLVHNQGKPSRLKVGRIDEHFPLLGVYADSFKELQEKFGNNDAYLWFTYQLYLGEGRQQMIPQEYDKKAEEIAKQMLYNDFKKYGFTENQVDQWIDFATSWNNYADFRKDKIKGAIQLVRDRGNCYSTIFIRPA